MEPGWIVGLSGDLGAGKTQLVKGLAAGWEIKGRVASPTFNLLHEHETATEPLIHMDLCPIGITRGDLGCRAC